MVVILPLLTDYNKKKDAMLTTNFQITISTRTKKHPLNLQRYTSIVKKEVTKLLKKPNYQQSNLTTEKSLKIKYLSESWKLTIKGPDKDGMVYRHGRL